jgi:hypothetical protein
MAANKTDAGSPTGIPFPSCVGHSRENHSIGQLQAQHVLPVDPTPHRLGRLPTIREQATERRISVLAALRADARDRSHQLLPHRPAPLAED